jgi:transglutaminase-like putative cysteine protease
MTKRPWFFHLMLHDWQRRLTVLLVGLFLYQYLLWIEGEGEIFLPETFIIVKWTLVLTFALEWILPSRSKLRIPTQFILLIVYNAVTVGYQPISGSVETFPGTVQLLIDNAIQLVPFVWFSLGAWLLYIALLEWVSSKGRIAFVMCVSVLFFAIRDSFSLIELWDQTAIVVFCCLSLLVIRHFTELKKKNPTGWVYMADYPLTAVTPVILIIGVIMLLGVIAPTVPATVMDPYSYYKSLRGESVPAFGKGTSDSGGEGTANASSGYSRNDQNLGGGFEFNYEPVMKVETTHRAYWRGESRSLYNGLGWEASNADKQAGTSVEINTGLPRDPRLAGNKLKTITVTQTVTFEGTDKSYPVLFGAHAIEKLISADGGTAVVDKMSWSARQGELRFQEKGKPDYPKSYTVISQLPIIDEAGLRTATAGVPAGMEEYLQLPTTLPQRVKDLAQQVTASGATPYDKVKLLEQFLQQTYSYTNNPDTSKAKSKDFVDQFLFEVREGYCDYYSTAMAVMSRAIGMPARWVKGFASGSVESIPEDIQQMMQDASSDVVNRDGAGIYTVKNSDAHSWVEVYFAGWGWVQFEPTSGFSLPTTGSEVTQQATPEMTDNAVPAPADPSSLINSIQQAVTSWINEVLIIAGSVVVVIALVWFGRQQGWVRLLSREPDATTFNQKIIVEYNRFLRRSRRRGYAAYAHDTARETIDRWVKKASWLSDDLQLILDLFEKAKYSGRNVTSADVERMTSLTKKLRGMM